MKTTTLTLCVLALAACSRTGVWEDRSPLVVPCPDCTSPHDWPAIIGFGADGSPCSAQDAFVQRRMGAKLPALASSPIRIPADGTITAVYVVHAVEAAVAECGPSDRSVAISNPVDEQIPAAPGVHETLHWTASDVESAPIYEMPETYKSKAVVLGRKLSGPLHVEVGDYVHIGSVLDDEAVCALVCDTMLDGADVPSGHARCTQGEKWSGCGALPYQGAIDHVALMAWVDFEPE